MVRHLVGSAWTNGVELYGECAFIGRRLHTLPYDSHRSAHTGTGLYLFANKQFDLLSSRRPRLLSHFRNELRKFMFRLCCMPQAVELIFSIVMLKSLPKILEQQTILEKIMQGVAGVDELNSSSSLPQRMQVLCTPVG